MSSNICPFCQQANRCNVNSDGCWCQRENIPRSLIDLLPLDRINRTCICVNCVKLYKLDENAFKARLNGQTE
ncbi:cysteine-rich CWC family protein [Psychromonas marina]|uniref:cysteine-rich CWC family protein n=1 Tax=Psychromonas marina TaxID=88364 RepID=UPI003D66C647